jgi:hypothetical protein
MSNDVVIMNIRSRKQTYSTALIIVQTLKSYHAAFSIDLKPSKQKKQNISKLHKDDLLVESRYWKQMLRHRFSQKFQIAVQKKFSELKKRDTFFWMKKTNQSGISLIWVFKYKFDIDHYLKKFKTRYVSKMIFNRRIKTRTQQLSLRRRFVLWWSFWLRLIWKFDSTTQSALSSIVKLMKNCTMSARTNFFDSITVESWIKLYTN